MTGSSNEFQTISLTPELLSKYEKVIPGSAERLLKMAEDETTHKVNIQKRKVEMNKSLYVEVPKLWVVLVFITIISLLTYIFYLSLR